VRVALVTTYLSDYRLPLYRRLAASHGLEVLCYGRGGRYAPPWFADLDAQLAAADFPARALTGGAAEALSLGRGYDAVIAPFAGGSMLPAAYAGARRFGAPFVLWASVWHQPRSSVHLATLPLIHHIYRDADAVIAYGEHVRRFVKRMRGRDDDVFIAAQAVEQDLFARPVSDAEIAALRERFALGDGPLVLYTGRLEETKGIAVLAEAWPRVAAAGVGPAGGAQAPAQLLLVGDGPLRDRIAAVPGARAIGPLPRAELAIAYAASAACVVPSIPTPRFKEPWGLVVNEAMSQARPVIATTAVGAAAGGLVRDTQTGLVIEPGDPDALAGAIDRVLANPALARTLGQAGATEIAAYTYDAMATGVAGALAAAGVDPA
jgi:glycosyltransferase involved in cell wall biosynthesis